MTARSSYTLGAKSVLLVKSKSAFKKHSMMVANNYSRDMFATFAIILISSQVCIAKKHETVTKNFQFPNKKLTLSEPFFNDKIMYYAMCAQPPKHCTIVQEKNPFVKLSVTKKCDVTLEADNIQLVAGFGKDRAVIISQEQRDKSTMLKATSVHIESCKTVNEDLFEIPSNWKGTQLYHKYMDVVPFENGFEIVIKELSQICSKPNEKLYCGIIFDDEGKKLVGPIVWPRVPYLDINVAGPILPDPLGMGYIFINEQDSLIGIQLDRKPGPDYAKLWGPMKLYADHWEGGYSTANNLIGICYAENSTLRCYQNTAEGAVAMRSEFDFKHQHQVAKLSIHNLRNRGFIASIITCPKRVCAGTEDHYHLMKIDAQGKMVGQVDVSIKSQCNANNGNILAKVYENEQGEYCAVRMCKSRMQDQGRYEAVVNCYSDDYFSK